MKTLITTVSLILCAHAAQADTLLEFRDRSTYVWASMYEKGSEFCTMRAKNDELCVEKSDVVRITRVKPGTARERSSTASLSQSDSIWAAQYNEAEVNKKKADDAAYYKKIEKDRATRVRFLGEEKVQQMERAGNSVK